MTQELNREQALALFKHNTAITFHKFGYRMVVFFQTIEAQNLQDVSTAKVFDPWTKESLEGFGALYDNPKDGCQQAIILMTKKGIPKKNCLIFPLGDDIEKATTNKDIILSKITKPLDNADVIKEFIKKAGDITKDVYCSGANWFDMNTIILEGTANMEGPNFVEARANPVEVLYIPGEIAFTSEVTATPQMYKNGMVLIRQDLGEAGFDCYGCEPEAFASLYRIKDEDGLHPVDFGAFTPVDLHHGEKDAIPLAGAVSAKDIGDE